VTAFYEIVPVEAEHSERVELEPLRYRRPGVSSRPEVSEQPDDPVVREWLAVKLRYQQPEGNISKRLVFPLDQELVDFEAADRDFRWAAAMVEFGMLLRHSRYRGTATWNSLLEVATSAAGMNPSADRQECLEMIRTAARLRMR
jgi:Ca-activated chloride channel family protein